MRADKHTIGEAQLGPTEAHNSSLIVGTAVGRHNDAVESTSSSNLVPGNVREGKQTNGEAQLGPIEAHNSSLTAGTAISRHNDAVESTSSSDLVLARLFSLQLRVNAKSFKDLIPMLIVLLPMTGKESPFKTNAAEMWVLVVSTIIFCLANRTSNAAVAFISGSLSTVSLLSIYLPKSIGFLVFIPWFFVPLVVAYQPIRSIFNNIHGACLRLDQQMILEFISKFSVIWKWLTGSNSNEQEQEQPRARVSP